jgi:hypothetical protein
MASFVPSFQIVEESIGATVSVWHSHDFMRDVAKYKAKCVVCGVNTGWVEFDMGVIARCADPVAFVAGALKQWLLKENCAESDWGKRDQAEAQQLTCTEPEGFDGVDPSERLKKVSEALGTPHVMTIERNAAQRAYDVVIRCSSCKRYGLGWVAEDSLEAYPRTFDEFADTFIAPRRAYRDGDLDETKACCCVDGLTPSMCMQVWVGNQRAVDAGEGRFTILTPRQIDAARTAWSAELRKRQSEAREKERCQVVVDWQDEP